MRRLDLDEGHGGPASRRRPFPRNRYKGQDFGTRATDCTRSPKMHERKRGSSKCQHPHDALRLADLHILSYEINASDPGEESEPPENELKPSNSMSL